MERRQTKEGEGKKIGKGKGKLVERGKANEICKTGRPWRRLNVEEEEEEERVSLARVFNGNLKGEKYV